MVPVAGCHVEPPSVETSTPATTPPTSLAVPETVLFTPSCSVAPFAGEVTVAVGAVVSVDLLASVRPLDSAKGCAPMSAKRLTVACWMFGSGGLPLGLVFGTSHALVLSRPHDHCTVPAPKTRAPLGARYIVRWWVAVWLMAVVLP